MTGAPEERASWGFEEGALLAPDRTVLRTLGGGSRYEVCLVWDEHRFALLVAKVLRPDQAGDEGARRDLEREAEVLARLAHPVIVRSFGAVLDGPHPHLLLEHLEGPTLRSLIRRGGPLPVEQAVPLAMHAASALHYMAAEGVVHLDVKPDNIVMGIPPRLIDLSIARPVARAARLRSPLGTDPYMAPEQCAPDAFPGAVGPAADVWGLGATLFHALAGATPFPRPAGARESADPAVRFPQLVRPPERLPRHVPPALADAVAAALRTVPEERPSAAELATALEPVLAALPRRIRLGRRPGR